MPPRKRAKASAASTPLAETQPKTPHETPAATQSQDRSSPQNENQLDGPWSDEQETQLFKSMIKWKPTGLNKHFHMILIYKNMLSHGYVTDDAPHTRIPGLWRKLDTLYDLHALDERENSYTFNDNPEPTDPEEAYSIPEFELPEEEFGELMWQARFRGPDSEASSSPPLMPTEDDKAMYQPGIGLLKDIPGGPSSQKADSVSGATPTPKTRNTRGRAATKSAKGAKAAPSAKKAKTSKARSEVSESVEEEDEDEDEEESSEDESAESEADTAPSTRRTNRSTKQAKPAPKRTRKR